MIIAMQQVCTPGEMVPVNVVLIHNITGLDGLRIAESQGIALHYFDQGPPDAFYMLVMLRGPEIAAKHA